MHASSLTVLALVASGVLACALQPPASSACARAPATATPAVRKVAAAGPAEGVTPTPSSAEGTWLFRCCDGASTWVGMLALVLENGTLHGAWLTDGDSHGSYLEGRAQGSHVELWRRWQTGNVKHEQRYDLTLDESGQHLSGIFREPVFDDKPHGVELERGFVSEPRRQQPTEAKRPTGGDGVLSPLGDAGADKSARDAKRPCNCKLVCYCGGVPPGADHYAEAARCGGSCKCAVCPPLP